MQPKVSVIVPVYNTEVFLQQCVQSIAAQSFRNLEIILVDDGSSDRSADMCDDYAQSDSRVIVIHKENGGAALARRAGLDAATGDYVTFVDGDDWLDVDMISQLVQVAQRDKADCVLCSYMKEYRQVGVENYLFDRDFCYEADDAERLIHQRLIGPNAEQMRYPERINNLSTTWGKLYTLETARKGLFVNEREIGYSEDTLFNIYALEGCHCISYVHRCLYHYRKYNSRSLTAGYRPMLADKYGLFYTYVKNYIDQSKQENYRQLLLNRIACGMISLGLNEMNMPGGFIRKAEAIRKILNRPEYRKALGMLECRHCPVQWKFFFFLCKNRLAFSLIGLLLIIEWLRNRKNRTETEARGDI